MLFTRFLIFPPLTPGLVSFASAGILGLLRQAADRPARAWIPPSRKWHGKARRLGRITARQVRRRRSHASRAPARWRSSDRAEGGQYRFLAGYGALSMPGVNAGRAGHGADRKRQAGATLFDRSEAKDELLALSLDELRAAPVCWRLRTRRGGGPSSETLQLATAIASAAAGMATESDAAATPSWWRLPRGVEAKAAAAGSAEPQNSGARAVLRFGAALRGRRAHHRRRRWAHHLREPAGGGYLDRMSRA